jgi:hypothetical protein
MWQEAALSAIILRPTLEAELTKHMAKMDAKAVTAEAVQGTGSNTTRVGRWMSQAEYDKMVNTGKVQESHTSNTTYVANPATPEAFGRQASPGSIYVEFDVPTSALKSTQEGWARIIGPNTIDARLLQKQGVQPPTAMPNATNIEIVTSK